jgi:cytochrome c oxidase cbb3-type subunit 2
MIAQVDPFGDFDGLQDRYGDVNVRNFDGNPALTEMDALVAYLQMLGTLVDFSTFEPDASR